MWGERASAGFFEDVHVLIVVVLGMSILLASLAAAFTAHEAAREAAALRAETSRILRAVLSDPGIVHDGAVGLFDIVSIERLNSSGLARLAGGVHPVLLVVSERGGASPRTFLVQTDTLGSSRTSASTAAALWYSDLDVRAARVTITLAGS